MARDFDGTNDYLEHAALVLPDPPFTMACWFNADNATAAHSLMSFGTSGATNRVVMFANGTVAGDPIVCSIVIDGNVGSDAITTTGFTAGQWHLGVISLTATNGTPAAYIDGGSKGTGSASAATLSGMNRTLLGARISGSVGAFHNGRIAHPAIWNVALDDAEVAALAKAFSPLLIRPASLVAYWPLPGNGSPEPDIRGRFEMTVNGATKADGPRIYRPRSAQIYKFPKPAGSGVSGSGTPSEAADTSTATGILGHHGSGTPSEAADTAEGTGKRGHYASGSPSEAADTSSASGVLGHTGSGSPSEAADTCAGEGTVTNDQITGSGSPSEAADTSSGTGLLGHHGSGSPSEATDTAAGTGKLGHVGSGAPSEADDSGSGSGFVGAAQALTAADLGGGRGAKAYRKYPRKLMVDGRVVVVRSLAEERALLQALQERAEDDAKTLEALGDGKVAVLAKRRAIKLSKRLDTVSEQDKWLTKLRSEDEELLLFAML